MPTWVLLILFSAATSLVGTIATKHWVQSNRPLFFIIALAFYSLTTLSWMFALKRERLVVTETLWEALVLILTISLGLFVFHEHINLQEKIGVALAVVATLLITIKF